MFLWVRVDAHLEPPIAEATPLRRVAQRKKAVERWPGKHLVQELAPKQEVLHRGRA